MSPSCNIKAAKAAEETCAIKVKNCVSTHAGGKVDPVMLQGLEL